MSKSLMLSTIRLNKYLINSSLLRHKVIPSYFYASAATTTSTATTSIGNCIKSNYNYSYYSSSSIIKSNSNNKISKKKDGHPSSSSSSSSSEKETDNNKTNDNNTRNKTINMNPKGYSYLIQPNNQIYRIDKRRPNTQNLVQIDRVYGFFWMLKDLRENDAKPILGNTELVKEDEADVLPSLYGLETLDGHIIDIPDIFIRSQRPTVMTFSFKDFGYQLLSSWTNPVREKFQLPLNNNNNNKQQKRSPIQVVNINITEGSSIFSLLFKKFILYSMKKNTDKELHNTTYTYFGNNENIINFRDCLRMHNTYTSYVILIDKFGRLRWMGSGKATDEEIENLSNGIDTLIQHRKG